ncbi:MAG TPA: divalent metal cation transporter [Candidatus Dormibacteraeota bacterium]|nr:divalent metal cation transporter [Candidatus Dormibacteraeota bacterium]
MRARRGGSRWRLLWLLVGPGVLVMLGENDGPSMLSYTATGATYGVGFFLPFILLTFVGAMVVQEMALRVGAITHRGYGELVFQRYGHFWGWVSIGDLVLTNVITLVTEFIAIRVGMAYFGIRPELAVALGVLLVAFSITGGRYWRWERAAMALAAFNMLFVAAAVVSKPDYGAVGHAFLTGSPLPGGSLQVLMLIIASNVGATVTPWMIFFQQSAVVDKGVTPKDLRQGRLDVVAGGFLAALAGCGALVAAAVLYTHHVTPPPGLGGVDYAGALRGIAGPLLPSLLSLGLIEAGALACLTISTATAYSVGEAIGGAHSFNRSFTEAPLFYSIIVGIALLAGLVVLIPGAPLLNITLNANLLATILMPAALTFLVLLANDREIMGSRANDRRFNVAAALVMLLVVAAGAGSTVVTFFATVSGKHL